MMAASTLASTFTAPKLSSNSIPYGRTPPHRIQFCDFPTVPLLKKKLVDFQFARRKLGFVVKSSAGDGQGGDAKSSSSIDAANETERQSGGESTMPERFRHLIREVPEPPARWPYYIALAFLVYAWRMVLWELSNWKNAITSILRFFTDALTSGLKNAITSILGFLGYLPKLALALIFHFIGDPLTSTIRAFETTFYALRAFYSKIVAYTPIPELTTIIILASAILAIGEVASPNAVDTQWHLLTISGLLGYFAVTGAVGDLLFWTGLFGLFSFSHFMKKRDYVSSALPVAAVLVGVGEPWVRFVVMGSYVALAVVEYSKKHREEEEEGYGGSEGSMAAARRVPVPLLCAGLAIGIRVAARWAGYRHLTWMVV